MWASKWGQMLWGTRASVPAMSMGSLVLLSVLLLAIGYWMGKRSRVPRWLPWVSGIAAALLPLAAARAANLVLPFTFTNGTVADANQVNQNFASVATQTDHLRQQVEVVNECAFQPREGADQRQCGFGNGGAFITTPSSSGGMVAPLYIPSGATITNIQAFVSDSSAAASLQICLLGITDSSAYVLGGCLATTGSAGNTQINFNVNVVQGNGVSYELRALSVDGTGTSIVWPSSSIQVRSVYVRYEVPL
jgi:hypothetical protein